MADFRFMARECLQRAKDEMASGDPHRLRFAALELRYAMEAVTYDRARAYRDDIPPSEYSTWPPKKVLGLLTDIDPHAALNSTISIGREETYGVAPEKMALLGTDSVLTMARLKKHYDRLGSYLHAPTLAKIDDPSAHDPAKLRAACETCAAILDEVLSSPVWNFTVGQFSDMPCLRCGKAMRKRLPRDGKAFDAACFECEAEYRVEPRGDKLAWTPYRQEVPCQTEGCPAMVTLWKDQVREGERWACQGCGKSFALGFAVFPTDAP